MGEHIEHSCHVGVLGTADANFPTAVMGMPLQPGTSKRGTEPFWIDASGSGHLDGRCDSRRSIRFHHGFQFLGAREEPAHISARIDMQGRRIR